MKIFHLSKNFPIIAIMSNQEGRDEQIVSRYRGGFTLRTLSNKYGVTAERIRQILNRLGVETRPPGRTADPSRVRHVPVLLQDRFFSKVVIKNAAGREHWVWDKTDAGGYGTFGINGTLQYAHRAAFFLVRGRWPRRLKKLCPIKGCVNPICWVEWRSTITANSSVPLV